MLAFGDSLTSGYYKQGLKYWPYSAKLASELGSGFSVRLLFLSFIFAKIDARVRTLSRSKLRDFPAGPLSNSPVGHKSQTSSSLS